MAVTFAVGLRACCVAVGLLLVSARAAEPVSPLIGVTRNQLLSRNGEPKSQMEVGNREIFFYPREKIVLRDGVVVEVEQFASETPAAGAPAAAAGTQTDSPPARPTAPAVQTPAKSAPPTAQTPTAPSDSKVEIKLVRSPSAKDGRVVTVEEPKAKSAPTAVVPTPAPPPKSDPVVPDSTKKTASTVEKNAAPPVEQKAPEPKAEATAEKKAADDLAAKKKKEATATPTAVRTAPASTPAPAPEESILSNRTFLIGIAVLLGGAGLLFWKYRQRQMELLASSVENTPVAATSTPAFAGSGFSADVLNKLEWKRFEELVTAYYNKTGVVATRTKAGPNSPIHIKISWKGEPRPFAYVHCIAQPTAIVDARPLQALVTAMAADDIRRGYVVTTGKFNVVARDFGDQKHLTLLSGETLLEKLNAMPTAARTEIMQAVSAGDYSVPSCPKCEAKMVQSADNPPVWRCPNHPTESLPVRSSGSEST